jgi:SsrA-binding protein
MAKEGKTDEVKVLVRNRRASFDFAIEQRVEAGLVLVGSEVKSLREGHATLNEGWAQFRDGEAWLCGVQIQPYPWANRFNHDPFRERKLLLHRREIAKLSAAVQRGGYTVVPLQIYLKSGRIKVELGLARGKARYEKRQAKREAEAAREIEQAMRRR